jgi:hypothetical protein
MSWIPNAGPRPWITSLVEELTARRIAETEKIFKSDRRCLNRDVRKAGRTGPNNSVF